MGSGVFFSRWLLFLGGAQVTNPSELRQTPTIEYRKLALNQVTDNHYTDYYRY